MLRLMAAGGLGAEQDVHTAASPTSFAAPNFGFGRSGITDGKMSPTGRPDDGEVRLRVEKHASYRRELDAQVLLKQQRLVQTLAPNGRRDPNERRAVSPSGSTAQLFGGLGTDRETARLEVRRKAERYAAELRKQVELRNARESAAKGAAARGSKHHFGDLSASARPPSAAGGFAGFGLAE